MVVVEVLLTEVGVEQRRQEELVAVEQQQRPCTVDNTEHRLHTHRKLRKDPLQD